MITIGTMIGTMAYTLIIFTTAGLNVPSRVEHVEGFQSRNLCLYAARQVMAVEPEYTKAVCVRTQALQSEYTTLGK